MIGLDIPGYGSLALTHLVLDLNGTIAAGGELIEGVAEGLRALAGSLTPVIVTADTRGTAASLAEHLGVELHVVAGEWEAGDKLAFIQELGSDAVAAIGNGSNDALMLKASAVGVCVIGPEGASKAALEAADVVVTSVVDAIALFAEPARLLATLRTGLR
ncbi:MAG: HAD family hydrolase [Coriobacteriia bacterium]|nr:HAD family hydrolase [Coriobacteriia bacterium]